MVKVKGYILKLTLFLSMLGILILMGIGLYSAFEPVDLTEDDLALGVLLTGLCMLVAFALFIPDKDDLA